MPKKAAAKAPQNDTQAPTMPGAPEIQALRNLLDALGTNLTDTGYANDFELLSNSSCNALFQAVGIGIILNNEGEFSMITPFGLIQNVATLSEEDDWKKVFDELEQLLTQFCEVAAIDEDILGQFVDLGEKLTGFWIISQSDTVIHKNPRVLEEREWNPPMDLEEEWTKMVG
jgi:hypothetical protein